MRYETHPAAHAEADEAADWYGCQEPALGLEFARQYERAVEWIEANPRMSPPAEDGPPGVECRNLSRLGRFPYRVVYVILDDGMYILAVAHHKRRPGYWHDRLPTDPGELP